MRSRVDGFPFLTGRKQSEGALLIKFTFLAFHLDLRMFLEFLV